MVHRCGTLSVHTGDQVAAKASYLKRSKTGWYSYRRKVPHRLRAYFPRTAAKSEMVEWKASFKTKDPLTAQRLWAMENIKFEAAQRAAETLLQRQQGTVTGHDALPLAKAIAEQAGFHPEQAPQLPPDPNDEDWQRYKIEKAEWDEWIDNQREILLQVQLDEMTDHDQLARDYASGVWGQEGYATPHKKQDPNNAFSLAGKILEGDLRPELTATWSDAVETYIAVNKQDTTREPLKEKKWEAKTRGLLNKFAKAFKAKSLSLEELDRGKIRLWLLSQYPNQGTRNRYINTFSAVINTWNRENPSKPVPNPFSGLANKQREVEQATKRLSFNPQQFDKFLTAIHAHKNDEIRLVGLLMAYTGCRTSEGAGLQCRDVKLDAEVPHVVFRTNKIRRMDKGGLERAVPLVEPLLSALKGYNRKAENDDPFFARYGNTRGFDSISVALRNTLREAARIDQDGLVPYSLRHTMKDRLGAAGAAVDVAEYVLGHTSQGASRIHQRYGTKTPPRSLVAHIENAFQMKEWGYYEDE